MTRSAAKELERVRTKDRQRIVAMIRTLAANPQPVGAEKLSGEDKYRMRQGDYRILYEIVDTDLIVTVVPLRSEYLPKPLEHHRHIFRRRQPQPPPQPIRRERANLPDFHPRSLRN